MDKSLLQVPSTWLAIASPKLQCGATRYPHSRVDSSTLLENPVDTSVEKARIVAAPKAAQAKAAGRKPKDKQLN